MVASPAMWKVTRWLSLPGCLWGLVHIVYKKLFPFVKDLDPFL